VDLACSFMQHLEWRSGLAQRRAAEERARRMVEEVRGVLLATYSSWCPEAGGSLSYACKPYALQVRRAPWFPLYSEHVA